MGAKLGKGKVLGIYFKFRIIFVIAYIYIKYIQKLKFHFFLLLLQNFTKVVEKRVF